MNMHISITKIDLEYIYRLSAEKPFPISDIFYFLAKATLKSFTHM